jgi:TRAP-type C4-dicarboxylate transport system substrate-binding protein
MTGRTSRWAATAAALTVIGACTNGPAADVADKTGGETVVLRMATIDGEVHGFNGPGTQAFLDSLAELSSDRLKVVMTTSFGEGAADAESKLVEAIASGEIDGGWPATRAFAAAGIEGLEAVEAPMMITSYAAAKELVSGPVADSAIAALDGSGVVGLGLAVAELRRPFAADAALLGPEDWQGIRFRSFNSPTQSAAISALGAVPVNAYADWQDQVAAGELRGIEAGFGVPDGPARNVTGNVVLWPKVPVFSVSQKRYDALSDEQRGWLRQAAASATQASVEATWDESTQAAALCNRGFRFVDATSEQLANLRAAWKPVIDDLAADPESGPLMEEIERLGVKYPDADVLEVPASCRQPAEPPAELEVPDQPSTFPAGIYRMEVTLDDVRAAGLNNGPGFTGTWTLTVEDGTYQLSCRVIDRPDRDCGTSGIPDHVYEAGHLRGTGPTVYFAQDVELLSELSGCTVTSSNIPDRCHIVDPYSMTWELDADGLTFSELSSAADVLYAIKPWQKID